MTYDPAEFLVERQTSFSSVLGQFRLGYSKLGDSANDGWIEVPAATFNYTFDYTRDEFGTLILGAETASISVSFDKAPTIPPLVALDKVRVIYKGKTKHLMTVDHTTILKRPVDETRDRYDFVATLVGTYAAAMGKEICYGDLPKETPLKRISRWVKVIGY